MIHRCPFCPAGFFNASDLERHYARHDWGELLEKARRS